MDPLTHVATGLFLGRAGLNRLAPQAPWILLLAALGPDVDVVAATGGALGYLNYHRHLTHSLVVLPLFALLPVALVRLATRQPLRWKAGYALSLAGVASHLALDYTNIYGERLLLPFSGRWFALDITSVVDLWIWAALLVGLLGPAFVRLVYAELGARTGVPGRGFAIFALAFMLLYNGGRALLHARAVATLDSRIYGGSAPLRVAALPGPFNPFKWRGLVETRESYSLYVLNLLEEFDPARGTVYYKPEPVPAIDVASRTRVFQDFLKFSQYPLWQVAPVSEPENGTRVEAMDLRFGNPMQPAFVATAILGSRLEVLRSGFQFGVAAPR